jgi:signal transduction histidine kinase
MYLLSHHSQAEWMVNAVLAAMTLFAIAFWLMRRQEAPMAWLAAIGLIWFLHNLRYSVTMSAVEPAAFPEIVMGGDMLLMVALTGFAASYFQLPQRKRIILFAAVLAAVSLVARYILLHVYPGSFFENIFAFFAMLLILGFYAHEMRKRPLGENIAMALSLLVAFLFMVHDMGRQGGLLGGVGFPLMPYAGLILFATFSLAIGRRMLRALSNKETQAAVLGERIETTKANLLFSESARRSLEISNAITRERERMMREIHDGIGSSLVAALASAERQGKQNTTAVVALKSALTDLRIAVDSLEPVEGNVATLLASLRYRLEPEMKKANIDFDWKVDDVPELDWLDSPNALHVLRIFQESFGNILGHANASRIRVGCRMEIMEGRPGIMVEVADNGDGFDPSVPPKGRGRRNMLDRAEALGGKLRFRSAPGSGSSTLLWLPILREKMSGSG